MIDYDLTVDRSYKEVCKFLTSTLPKENGVNIFTRLGTFQVTMETNLWSNQKSYWITKVKLDENKNVINCEHETRFSSMQDIIDCIAELREQ